MTEPLTLVSFHLCPYVQRAAISLAEKGVPFERIYIDLADKPDWFLEISPLGKVPLLKVGDEVIFESAVILEYLEETQPKPLLPMDPLLRARHRGLIEYGSSLLGDIWGFYAAATPEAFEAKRARLAERFAWLEAQVAAEPWFFGEDFSLVDAVFGPVFRYFDAFEQIGDFEILSGKPKLARWRAELAGRPTIREAVRPDYPERLWDFLLRRNSQLSKLMAEKPAQLAS